MGLVASTQARRGRARLARRARARCAPQLHTPAGLDIGARAPTDVAISILAELVAERTAHPPQPAPAPVAPGTAIDPVCGMEVAASDATLHLDVGGERVYFCCEGCRSTYAAQHAGDVAAR